MSPATAYVTLLAVKAKFTTSSNTCPECRSGSGAGTHLQWRRLSRSTRKSSAFHCFASDDIDGRRLSAARRAARRPGRGEVPLVSFGIAGRVHAISPVLLYRIRLEVRSDIIHVEVRACPSWSLPCASVVGLSPKRGGESQKPAAAINPRTRAVRCSSGREPPLQRSVVIDQVMLRSCHSLTLNAASQTRSPDTFATTVRSSIRR